MSKSNIFSRILSRFATNQEEVPHRIYGGLVAQARKSSFYTNFAIPDTVMGRYGMLGLHVFLLNNRLKNADCNGRKECQVLSQKVFDLFVIDLERGLRDIGFADTSVKKRKKKLVHSYYALIEEFDTAIEKCDKIAIAAAAATRYYTDIDPEIRAGISGKLATYILLTANQLGTQDMQACLDGDVIWPDVPEETA